MLEPERTMRPQPMFFHARELEYVVFGTVRVEPILPLLPVPNCSNGCVWGDEYHEQLTWDASYRWLESLTVFWPLFLAVGTEDAVYMTGYRSNWTRVVSTSREGTI